MHRSIYVHVHRTRDASSRAALVEDLANRMAAALEQVMGWVATKDAFREEDHPRAPDGRFGDKPGEHGRADADLSQPKPTSAKGANAKTRLRELLESGHPFSKQELMAIAGITNESTFTSWISMMRNPKYAGKAGTLEVVKNKDGTYQAQPKGAAPPAPTPGPAKPAAPVPGAPITVVSERRVSGDGEGTWIELTLSDGSTAAIQRMNADEAMGLSGWHDRSINHIAQFSWLGDTKEEAIKTLLERRNEKAQKKTPAPTPAPKPASTVTKVPATTETAEQLAVRYRLESNKAGTMTRSATTIKQHSAAIKAHAKAMVTLEQLVKASDSNMADTRRAFHTGSIQASMGQIAKLQERAAVIAAKLPANEAEASARIEARYMASGLADIHRDLKNRFGLGVAGGDEKYPSGYMVRGIKRVDLESSGKTAKEQRRILGHVHHALASLESSGFDIKEALRDAHVEYAPATISNRMNGVAWQERASNSGYSKVGRFTVSGNRRLGATESDHENHQRRISQGLPSWSLSSANLGNAATRATIVHELTHALGLQPHIDSPARLERVLHDFQPNYIERKKWIKANVSEYATANIRETDAEIAAMVTDPAYKRGTLPKAFEDHVDWLFKRKKQ